MNCKFIFCPAFIIIAFSCNQKPDTLITRQLQEQLTQKNYFKLDEQYKAVSNDLADSDRLYYKAFLDNAFNRNTACIQDVDELLGANTSKPFDSAWFQLKSLQEDSYFKTFQYAKAAKCDSDILHNCKSLHRETLDDVQNDLIIRNGLKKTPPQQTYITNNTTIPWIRDSLGLMEIPFSTNSQKFNAIWDTRANISSVTQTYAKKLGLHLLNINYTESSGLTGIRFKTDMGIADSLKVGDIEIRNVVFQVMPDSILYIAGPNVQLNIIIGFPVIEQWGEVHIYQDGRMTVPVNPSHSELHNLAFNGLDPVIALGCGQDTLPFNFDSGATTSIFYLNYLNRYKKYILKNGFEKKMGFGGAGGAQMRKAYVLPKVSVGISGKIIDIDSVAIREEKIYPGETYYGNIGQDFVEQFSELVYNFRDMYIDGTKR